MRRGKAAARSFPHHQYLPKELIEDAACTVGRLRSALLPFQRLSREMFASIVVRPEVVELRRAR